MAQDQQDQWVEVVSVEVVRVRSVDLDFEGKISGYEF